MSNHASAYIRTAVAVSALGATPVRDIRSTDTITIVAVAPEHADHARAALAAFEFPYTERGASGDTIELVIPASAFPTD
jgi:hypothetical protein